ncbi:H/ACA ribonucleoprotein complex subunit 2 [Chaetomidium leptoderma]|uniref:H/ACA ribonucleoprotein complex subunit 2 n=1 Tax=Chaetomidium leptoderma TaxID=669021 RepID=A0AAN7A1Z7_9PEZI|nr:H/ACA ribonucleoprotein complex subunit 2 [Chaetomidium leptoderma]
MAAEDRVEVVDDKKLKKEKKSKDKSEKKDKKRSDNDGVRKEKKDKKKDKVKQDKLARALDAHLQADAAASFEDDQDEAAEVDPEDMIKPAEELVPFALPLADDKAHKKIYKLVKKGAKLKSIHRGVKECEKAIKKCPPKTAASGEIPAPGLVIIAADISPMDVIMHFPVLCEEHGVPYLYVRSRADLGVAACTKRATSVVMLKPEGKKIGGAASSDTKGKKKDADAEMEDADDKKVSAEDYLEAWKDLAKSAEKQWKIQVQPWVKGTHPLQIADREKARQASS